MHVRKCFINRGRLHLRNSEVERRKLCVIFAVKTKMIKFYLCSRRPNEANVIEEFDVS